jgi:hypothetical protein
MKHSVVFFNTVAQTSGSDLKNIISLRLQILITLFYIYFFFSCEITCNFMNTAVLQQHYRQIKSLLWENKIVYKGLSYASERHQHYTTGD